MKYIKFYLHAIILVIGYVIPFYAASQKLPSKQQESVWASDNSKIDAKASEWNNQFKAYNPATGIFYTIANNNARLYLTLYISDPTNVFYKAMAGGITFVIINDTKIVSIRYPAFNNNIPSLARLGRDEILSGKEDDPIIIKDNQVFSERAKDIEVIGLPIADTTISIFNEQGIIASGHFDAKQGYSYKLCIPLKYLNIYAGEKGKIKYKLILNGGKNKYVPSVSSLSRVTGGTRPDGTPISQSEIDGMNAAANAYIYARYAETNFTGEYTLANKP